MVQVLKSYEDVKLAVAEAGGVLTMGMETLRNVNGSGRLGPYVIEAISKGLAAQGLGHYPAALPQSQYEQARLFELGSQIAELHRCVVDVNSDDDEKLRELGTGDATRKLNEIRQIVC